jgi:hypothetical protein
MMESTKEPVSKKRNQKEFCLISVMTKVREGTNGRMLSTSHLYLVVLLKMINPKVKIDKIRSTVYIRLSSYQESSLPINNIKIFPFLYRGNLKFWGLRYSSFIPSFLSFCWDYLSLFFINQKRITMTLTITRKST